MKENHIVYCIDFDKNNNKSINFGEFIFAFFNKKAFIKKVRESMIKKEKQRKLQEQQKINDQRVTRIWIFNGWNYCGVIWLNFTFN